MTKSTTTISIREGAIFLEGVEINGATNLELGVDETGRMTMTLKAYIDLGTAAPPKDVNQMVIDGFQKAMDIARKRETHIDGVGVVIGHGSNPPGAKPTGDKSP